MGTVAEYNIDGLHISYDVDGEILSGEEKVLLQNEHNLIAGLDWDQQGYVILPFHIKSLAHLKQKVEEQSDNRRTKRRKNNRFSSGVPQSCR